MPCGFRTLWGGQVSWPVFFPPLHKAGAPTGAWVGLEGVCARLGGMVRSLDRLRTLSLETDTPSSKHMVVFCLSEFLTHLSSNAGTVKWELDRMLQRTCKGGERGWEPGCEGRKTGRRCSPRPPWWAPFLLYWENALNWAISQHPSLNFNLPYLFLDVSLG